MKNNKNALAGTILTGAMALLSATADAQSSAAANPVSSPNPTGSAAASPTNPAGPIYRVGLLQHDLSAPGRQTVVVMNYFQPNVTAPKHRHPGEEVVFVVEGEMEYDVDGQPPVILKAGDALLIPAETYHVVRNGNAPAKELATYILEKGKPVVEIAK